MSMKHEAGKRSLLTMLAVYALLTALICAVSLVARLWHSR